MSRRPGSVPLTGILRVWLTIYVLIWPALLVVAADWAFGSAAATTSVVFLIACLWAFLRYRRVSKRIFTVTTRRKRARR